MEHKREPIKHTCPAIDKYIKWIKAEIVKDRDLRLMNEQELFDAASSMSSQLEGCIDYLEELRSSNDTLRQWGIDEAERVDELAEMVDKLEAEQPITNLSQHQPHNNPDKSPDTEAGEP